MTSNLTETLAHNPNIILSMAGCPYCKKAVDLLMSKYVEFKYIPKEKNKTIDDEIRKVREGLEDVQLRRHTYPAIYMNGKLVGGFSKLQKYEFERNE